MERETKSDCAVAYFFLVCVVFFFLTVSVVLPSSSYKCRDARATSVRAANDLGKAEF